MELHACGFHSIEKLLSKTSEKTHSIWYFIQSKSCCQKPQKKHIQFGTIMNNYYKYHANCLI